MKRRQFMTGLMAGALGAASPLLHAQPRNQGTGARVVVVGGGFGGATAARYLKLLDASLDVLLIERSDRYVTCPMSNDYISGEREFASLVHGYERLRERHGVRVLHSTVTEIDPAGKTVTTVEGGVFPYDRLIVSPGIDFKWGELDGYDELASQRMPHAWKAGEQTMLLRRQLQAMPNGGVFVLASPAAPYRCPPGPYERVSLVANYFNTYKRASKILILDAKNDFIKQQLFMDGWAELYPRGMIEWVPALEGGLVTRVDVGRMELITESGRHRADVANVIPPHHAGQLAHGAGLTDETGWCPVNQQTFESLIHPGIHVIGDACIAGAMPKSGVSANTQAKVCAEAVIDLLAERTPGLPSLINACFSLVGPGYGISVAAVYELDQATGSIVGVKGAGGVSPEDATLRQRRLEAVFWKSWYENIVADTFG